MKRLILIAVMAVILAAPALGWAGEDWGMVGETPAPVVKHNEAFYQKAWCDQAGGVREFIFPDRSRCDCKTATHAIEFDWGHKWAEAIGQALSYAAKSGLIPGIVLIVDDPVGKDAAYIARVEEVIEYWALPIRLWIMQKVVMPGTSGN
ncbi:MAG: hypothetical protein KJ576_20970 [Proteobacteria bacterium]|nr:hypothetical protein [Pseudomonadota bacterium]